MNWQKKLPSLPIKLIIATDNIKSYLKATANNRDNDLTDRHEIPGYDSVKDFGNGIDDKNFRGMVDTTHTTLIVNKLSVREQPSGKYVCCVLK